jgi:hypothetical protein
VSGMRLLLPFDVDEPEFVRGFEAGRVWSMLHASHEREFVVHASNAEMMLRIAEAMEGSVQSVDLDETWMEVEFDV